MKLNYQKKSDILEFGQYRGKSIGFLFNWDIDYLEWCLANFKGFTISDKLQRLLNKIPAEKKNEQRLKRLKKRRFKKSDYGDDF